MKNFATSVLAPLLFLCIIPLGVNAADQPGKVEAPVLPAAHQSIDDTQISASPVITKAEVKRLEREKEKVYKSRDSMPERALMFTKNTLSY